MYLQLLFEGGKIKMGKYIYSFNKEFLKERLDQFIDHMSNEGLRVNMDWDAREAALGDKVALLKSEFKNTFHEIENMDGSNEKTIDICTPNDVKWLIVYGDLEESLSARIKELEDQLRLITKESEEEK